MPAMFVIPLVAGLVGALFSALVLRQFRQRGRPYQAAWGAALALFGAAALLEAAGVAGGWTPAEYRGYYLLGAILNVGWLGVGSVLILGHRAGLVAAAAMGLVTVAAIPAVLVAPVDAHLLAQVIPPRGAIGRPATLFPNLTNTLGTLALVGGAGWSAWRARREGAGAHRVLGTALIAAGALLVAGTHSLAQVRGLYAVQPLGEAVGIVTMFAGYLAVERREPRVAGAARPRTAS